MFNHFQHSASCDYFLNEWNIIKESINFKFDTFLLFIPHTIPNELLIKVMGM